jgi:hypothetical protein
MRRWPDACERRAGRRFRLTARLDLAATFDQESAKQRERETNQHELHHVVPAVDDSEREGAAFEQYQRPPSTKLSTVARRVASSKGCAIFVPMVVEIAAFANFWLQRGKGG